MIDDWPQKESEYIYCTSIEFQRFSRVIEIFLNLYHNCFFECTSVYSTRVSLRHLSEIWSKL